MRRKRVALLHVFLCMQSNSRGQPDCDDLSANSPTLLRRQNEDMCVNVWNILERASPSEAVSRWTWNDDLEGQIYRKRGAEAWKAC